MPATALEPYRYEPSAIFERFDAARPWHVLVTEAGAERRVAERAHPLGLDVYFPVVHELARIDRSRNAPWREVERPAWGRYVLAAARDGAPIARALAVRGVVEILGDSDGRPYALPGVDVLEWWLRQSRGGLDRGVRVGRRLFPRWVRIRNRARIVGGMTTFFARAVEGIIVAINSPEDIRVEATVMGRLTTISAPLVFLEKAE